MPVRSSSSSVLKWPDRTSVDAALRSRVSAIASAHPELLRLGYFGSYARGDWGVGSDLDLIAIVESSGLPYAERAREFDAVGLPVGAELLVYTVAEWSAMQREGGRFARELDRDAVWVFARQSKA